MRYKNMQTNKKNKNKKHKIRKTNVVLPASLSLKCCGHAVKGEWAKKKIHKQTKSLQKSA
jgi:hypothetical protein